MRTRHRWFSSAWRGFQQSDQIVGLVRSGGDGYLRPDQFLDHLTAIIMHGDGDTSRFSMVCAGAKFQSIGMYVKGSHCIVANNLWITSGVQYRINVTVVRKICYWILTNQIAMEIILYESWKRREVVHNIDLDLSSGTWQSALTQVSRCQSQKQLRSWCWRLWML